MKIDKTMSLSRTEFRKSVGFFMETSPPDVDSITMPAGAGSAVITYSPIEGVTLGGLLALPRATVSIEFDGVDDKEREQFMHRFDIAFQRGGG